MLSIEEEGKRGEEVFARLCDKWRCEYLHIGQEKDQLSSEMFRNYEKRPDFLVNIPNIAPIFVEVKVRELGTLRKDGPFSGYPAFGEFRDGFDKILNFESKMKVSTWYAFIMKTNGTIFETAAYMCPVSRMEKMIPKTVKDDPVRWPTLRISKECMNVCSDHLDFTDKCLICNHKICEALDW
jgi:hypothetical protein